MRLFLLSFSLLLSFAQGVNKLPNSSFEFPSLPDKPPLFWRTYNLPGEVLALTDNSASHSGKQSLRLFVPSTVPLSWYGLQQEFPVTPAGQKITLSVYIKTKGLRGGVGAYCSINFFSGSQRIAFFDSEEKVMGDSDWRRVSTSCVVPPGANRMSLILVVHGFGTAWFDDVQLEEGESATPYTPSLYDLELTKKVSSQEEGRRMFMKRKPKRTEGKDIAIFFERNFPCTPGTLSIDKLASKLKSAGFNVYLLGADELKNPLILSKSNFDLLILPYGPYFPAASAPAISQFLAEEGSLLTIGGYAFDTPLFFLDGKWFEKKELPIPAGEGIPILELERGQKWFLSLPAGSASYEITEEEGEHVLVFKVRELQRWATLNSPPIDPSLMPSDFLITSFKAKGDENTRKMIFEWKEKDGSRWQTVVDLTPQWREYRISIGDLCYWQDNPSIGRGGEGDRFRPRDADSFMFGISETEAPSGRSYTFYVKDIRVMPDPRGEEIVFDRVVNTRFGRLQDAMWPSPEQIGVFDPSHPLEDALLAKPLPEQKIFPLNLALKGPFTGYAAVGPIGKGAGHGFGPNQARILPLIQTYDEHGRIRGYLSSIIHNYDGYYKNSSWALFGVDNLDLFTENRLLPYLPFLVRTLVEKTYLLYARAQYACYRPGEAVKLVAEVANAGPQKRDLSLRLELRWEEDGKPFFLKEERISLNRGERKKIEVDYKIPSEEKRDFAYVVCSLLEGGEARDEYKDAFVIWQEALLRGERPKIENSYICLNDEPRLLLGSQLWWGQVGSVTACSPLLWSKDYQMMEDFGLHFTRCFLWPTWQATEENKRASDALVYLAQKHKILMFYTPNLFNSLDRNALKEQEEYVREIVRRYRKVPLFLLDICNEPSLTRTDDPFHREEFQEFLKDRYPSFDALKKAWGERLTERGWEEIKPSSLFSSREDVRARDTNLFYISWQRKWYGTLYEVAKKEDPTLPTSVGCLQGFGWGDTIYDPILLSQDLDFTNRHYYGDLSVFPLELKEIDFKWLGKPLSLGECGARNHPGFINQQEDTPDYNRRFLFLTHITFGMGGSFMNTWHWRDPMEGIFPFGQLHADFAPRQALYIMRAMALLFASLRPRYERPKIYVLAPQQGFVSGERMAFHDAFRRCLRVLLELKVDFEVITEEKLPLLPSDAQLLFYPSPFAISQATFGQLLDFLNRGGKLFLSGDISRDESLKPVNEDRLKLLLGEASEEVSGLRIGRRGKGEVFYLPQALEMEGKSEGRLYEVYRTVLERAGVERLRISPERRDLLAFRLPTKEGGEAFFLINYGKGGRFAWQGMEVELGDMSTGFLHISQRGEVLSLEAQGEVRLNEERIIKGDGHFVILSLSGEDIRRSRSLAILPLSEGEVEIVHREGELKGEVGEIREGRWVTLAKPLLRREGDSLMVEVPASHKFTIILLGADLEEAKKSILALSAL